MTQQPEDPRDTGDDAATQANSESADLSHDRLCARVGCSAVAVGTLTADYTDRVMAVGPLSPVREPQAHDLCGRHCTALTPPEGWELIRHDPDQQLH